LISKFQQEKGKGAPELIDISGKGNKVAAGDLINKGVIRMISIWEDAAQAGPLLQIR
jgi:hypothetical protein